MFLMGKHEQVDNKYRNERKNNLNNYFDEDNYKIDNL